MVLWSAKAIGLMACVATMLLLLTVAPAWTEEGRTPVPHPTTAQIGEQCVEPSHVMRRQHMNFLLHQRDETVRGGIRGKKYSLRTCVECHATPVESDDAVVETRSVQGFCDSCHAYAAVEINCFECHNDKVAP